MFCIGCLNSLYASFGFTRLSKHIYSISFSSFSSSILLQRRSFLAKLFWTIDILYSIFYPNKEVFKSLIRRGKQINLYTYISFTEDIILYQDMGPKNLTNYCCCPFRPLILFSLPLLFFPSLCLFWKYREWLF